MTKATPYSARELAFLKSRSSQPSIALTHKEFVRRFGRSDVTICNIRTLYRCQGWRGQRDCRYERVTKEGYVTVQMRNAGTGFRTRTIAKHRLLWEEIHGPLPADMVLKCRGEKSNSDPDNWEMIPRAILPRLKSYRGHGYDQAPEELKPTIMAVAKLEHLIAGCRRGAT